MSDTEVPPDLAAPATPPDTPARRALDAARARAQAQQAARAERVRADAAWVAAAQAGDMQAFRHLVEANQGRLFAVALGMLKDRDEAMDAVQDALIKAHQKLGDFAGNAAFSTWLHRICVNLCIDRQRAKARRRKVDFDEAQMEGRGGDDPLLDGIDIVPRLSGQNPLRNTANQELGRELERAMATLSDDHRTALLLREVEGLSYEEIAAVLEVPRGTVMSRLFHARRNMQRQLRPFLGLSEPGDPPAAPAPRGAHMVKRDPEAPGDEEKGAS